jgi:TPR repeat protein
MWLMMAIALADPCQGADCEAPCAQGDGDACVELGQHYILFRNNDFASGAGAYRTGCDHGHGESCQRLVSLVEAGKADGDVGALAKKAQKAMIAACKAGDGRACWAWSDELRMKMPEPDEKGAQKYLELACDNGFATACVELGDLGQAKAFALNLAACEKGSPVACYDTGVAYARGWGVPEDQAKFREYEGKACDLGLEAAFCRGR